MGEDDWEGWKLLIDMIGDKVQLVGDDLFVINFVCLVDGIVQGVVNLMLVKVNQIGLLIEMLKVVDMVYCVCYINVMLYCLGEIEDVIIVDFVVVINCGQIKIGLLLCFDCLVKYNQLICIEEMLGEIVEYVGCVVLK